MDNRSMNEQDDPQMNESTSQEAADEADEATEDGTRTKTAGGREMLVQLQQMIDTVATQAGPVMRDVAAKAAELAAVAGEKAGPWAYKAAGATEALGQRVAAKSKDFAADLRRPQDAAQDAAADVGDAVGDAADAGAEAADDVADAAHETADQSAQASTDAEPPADWSR
jgi:hypothetical protein